MGGSGGNFDEELLMDEAGKLAPAGPLTDSRNTMQEIYVWVVQTRDNGTAAAHLSKTDDPAAFTDAGVDSRWTDLATEPTQHGVFQPGPAVGLAFGVAKTPEDKVTVSWWIDSLNIVSGPPAGGAASGA